MEKDIEKDIKPSKKRSEVQQFYDKVLAYFAYKVNKVVGIEYRINYGRDIKFIKNFLKNPPKGNIVPKNPEKALKEVIDFYFKHLEPSGYKYLSVAHCLSTMSINKYLLDCKMRESEYGF